MNQKATTSLIAVFILSFFFLLQSSSSAQTIYKHDPGFFGSLQSFELDGGSFEDTQLIGPAFGYRFNKNVDISLHTELLLSEIKFDGRENGKTSLLNLGITLGRTKYLGERLMTRSEISLYKSFNFDVEGFPNTSDPSLNSISSASSIYIKLPLSNTVNLLPNIGGFIGYGKYDPPVTDADLTQAFDGFVAGPNLGLDFLFAFSDSFSMAVTPSYRHHFTDNAPYDGEFSLNFQFNF